MPIYEYKCKDCGHCFEQLVLSGSGAVKCPKCGKQKVERMMSVFASCGSESTLSSAAAGSSCGSGGFS